MPAGAEGRCARRCRRSARNLLHGVDQRLRSRPARRRRELSRAWRVERHWHDGDPTRARLWRACLRDRRQAREMRRLPRPRRRARDRLPAGGFCRNPQGSAQGRGVDVILDMVGGPYVEKNLRSLALEGRLVQIAFLQGSKVTLDLAHLMMRRQTITGSTLRPRPVAEKAVIARNLRDKVWPLIEAGKVRPVIDRTFPLAEAAAAHRLMESSAHIGKILLRTS